MEWCSVHVSTWVYQESVLAELHVCPPKQSGSAKIQHFFPPDLPLERGDGLGSGGFPESCRRVSWLFATSRMDHNHRTSPCSLIRLPPCFAGPLRRINHHNSNQLWKPVSVGCLAIVHVNHSEPWPKLQQNHHSQSTMNDELCERKKIWWSIKSFWSSIAHYHHSMAHQVEPLCYEPFHSHSSFTTCVDTGFPSAPAGLSNRTCRATKRLAWAKRRMDHWILGSLVIYAIA